MSIPASAKHLADSLTTLQASGHFGVLTANVDHIIDANDAILSMLGFTRDELNAGLIHWRAMTPPEYTSLDDAGIEQLEQFGACVPFEKELLTRDGKRLPILIGAVRVSVSPLEWACFVVDLTAQKLALEAQRRTRELQAQAAVVSVLAHEINNPLQILVNSLSLIQMSSELAPQSQEYLEQSFAAIERIRASLRAMGATLRSQT